MKYTQEEWELIQQQRTWHPDGAAVDEMTEAQWADYLAATLPEDPEED